MRLATGIFGHYLQENLDVDSYGVYEIFLQENLDVVSYGVYEIFYETGDGHFGHDVHENFDVVSYGVYEFFHGWLVMLVKDWRRGDLLGDWRRTISTTTCMRTST